MIRVLVHAHPTKMGGAKRHLESMMNALARYGEDLELFLLINDLYDTSVFDNRVNIIKLPARLSSGLGRLYLDNLLVNRIIKEKDIDTLLSFSNIGPIAPRCRHILFEMNALYFCKNIRRLYPAKTRADFAIKRSLIALCIRGADIVVTPSQSLKRMLVDTIGAEEKKISVLHHAMEPEFTQAKRDESIFDPEKISFLYPSHLARHKGVGILLEGVKLLKAKRADLFGTLEILCTFDREDEPEYFDELTHFIDKNGLESCIKFTGRKSQSQIASLYKGADYMIYTTECESFGFSMLEAKVFHLPALCSDIPINREISKKSAHYFRSDDPADLADKLAYFLENRPEEFDFEDELLGWRWDAYAKRLLKMIGELNDG